MGTITRLHRTGRIWRTKDKNKPAGSIDIGPGTPWANPFVPGRDGTRADVIIQFDKWLLNAPDHNARWIRNHLTELIGHDLVCTCAPHLCHGESLLSLAATLAQQAERTAPAPPPTIQLRLSVTESGERKHYLIRVSETGPRGMVLEAPANARWMLGNHCSVIAAWLRARDGHATPLEQISDVARATLKEPIAS